jgi:hypothetical protein
MLLEEVPEWGHRLLRRRKGVYKNPEAETDRRLL